MPLQRHDITATYVLKNWLRNGLMNGYKVLDFTDLYYTRKIKVIESNGFNYNQNDLKNMVTFILDSANIAYSWIGVSALRLKGM